MHSPCVRFICGIILVCSRCYAINSWRNSSYSSAEKCLLMSHSSSFRKSCETNTPAHLVKYPLCLPSFLNLNQTDPPYAFVDKASSIKCALRSRQRTRDYKSHFLASGKYTPSNAILSNPIRRLLEIVASKNISKLALLGDSMSIQTGLFLACDLLRTEGVEVLEYNLLPSIREFYGKFAYWHRSEKKILKVDILYPEYSCKDDWSRRRAYCKSGSSRQWKVFSETMTSLKSLVVNATIDSPVMILFNIGLHINSRDEQAWLMRPTLRAVLEFTLASKGEFFVFFRETSAQHFPGVVGGNYAPDEVYHALAAAGVLNVSASQPCCDSFPTAPLINIPGLADNFSLIMNVRNKAVVVELEDLDPDFRKYLPIIPFFKFTSAFFSFHFESSWMDCTHYHYAPMLFDGLWWEIASAARDAVNEDTIAVLRRGVPPRIFRNNTIYADDQGISYLVQNGYKRRVMNHKYLRNCRHINTVGIYSSALHVLGDGLPVASHECAT